MPTPAPPHLDSGFRRNDDTGVGAMPATTGSFDTACFAGMTGGAGNGRCVYCSLRRAVFVTTGSIGTSLWGPLLPVCTPAILSTTSMPSTTRANTA